MSRLHLIDWTACDLVEQIPGKQGGVPLVRATRIPADQIVEEWEMGSTLEEIGENYPTLMSDRSRN